MQIIRLEVCGEGIVQEDTRNILLYYNLEHWLRVTQGERVIVLKPNDIFLCNSKTAHTVNCSAGLYLRCEIDLLQMKALFPGKRLRFLCDSTAERSSNDDLLRKQMKTLLRCQLEPDEFRQARVLQESYGLLIFLAANYRLSEVDLKESADADLDHGLQGSAGHTEKSKSLITIPAPRESSRGVGSDKEEDSYVSGKIFMGRRDGGQPGRGRLE